MVPWGDFDRRGGIGRTCGRDVAGDGWVFVELRVSDYRDGHHDRVSNSRSSNLNGSSTIYKSNVRRIRVSIGRCEGRRI